MGEAVPGDRQPLPLRLDVVARDRQPALVAADLHVAAGHVAEEHHQGGALAEFGGAHFGLGGLQLPAPAAEDIDLPGGVHAGLVDLVVEWRGRRNRQRPQNRLAMAGLLAAVRTGGVG